MTGLLRFLFYGVLVRLVVLILLGLNVRHRERLPTGGPAILAANHNSHLDAMVLASLFPLRLLSKIHPAAAADYFLRSPLLAWFALNIVGIIPVARNPERLPGISESRQLPAHPLEGCLKTLERQEILIFFPEGTRGEPEQRAELKSGLAHLAQRCPDVPIIPIFMHGLGKALPRGEGLLVPFFCDVFVGEALYWTGDRAGFMARLEEAMGQLESEGHFSNWA